MASITFDTVSTSDKSSTEKQILTLYFTCHVRLIIYIISHKTPTAKNKTSDSVVFPRKRIDLPITLSVSNDADTACSIGVKSNSDMN